MWHIYGDNLIFTPPVTKSTPQWECGDFDPWQQPPPILHCVIPWEPDRTYQVFWYFKVIIMTHLTNITKRAVPTLFNSLKTPLLNAALSFCCLSGKPDEDNLQPIPPPEEQHSTLLPPPPSLFPPTSQSSTNTLTTTTNPKLQDAGVSAKVGGGVRRQHGFSERLRIRVTFFG